MDWPKAIYLVGGVGGAKLAGGFAQVELAVGPVINLKLGHDCPPSGLTNLPEQYRFIATSTATINGPPVRDRADEVWRPSRPVPPDDTDLDGEPVQSGTEIGSHTPTEARQRAVEHPHPDQSRGGTDVPLLQQFENYDGANGTMTTWAIIPVKPLRYGKSRLSHIMSPDERAELTTKMLNRTLRVLSNVAGIFRTFVISRDPAALKIARHYGAYTYGEGDKQDINQALMRGAQIAAAQDATGILIIPTDLPLITVDDVEMMLAGVAPPWAVRPRNFGNWNANHHAKGRADNYTRSRANGSPPLHIPRTIAICPDRNEDGTNALYVSPATGFEFSYGDGSFRRHLQEAKRLGMDSRVIHAPGLKFDLDTEEDWVTYQALTGEPAQIENVP